MLSRVIMSHSLLAMYEHWYLYKCSYRYHAALNYFKQLISYSISGLRIVRMRCGS